MRESTWRKIDKVYTTKRRHRLNQIYRGDPAEPANSARVIREENVFHADDPKESVASRLPWLVKLRKRIQ
jgi:hypothetical protein